MLKDLGATKEKIVQRILKKCFTFIRGGFDNFAQEGPKLGAPHCFLSSALVIFCRQTSSAPVLRLDSAGPIPGGACQQPHQWNPDSGGTPGPEPLVGSQWLYRNRGLHPDSPDAQSGQVGASIQATLLTSEDTGVALIKPPLLPGETTFIPQNSLYLLLFMAPE